jgi:hypothetical protein
MTSIEQQQRADVRAQLASPAWRMLVIGAGLAAGLLALIATRSPALAMVAVPVGMIAVIVLTWRTAGEAAGQAAYAELASARGWQPAMALPAPLTTPLLRDGDERTLERAYALTIAGRQAVVGHYSSIAVHRQYHDDGTVTEARRPPRHYTVIEVVTGLSDVVRFSLMPRHAGGDVLDGVASRLSPDRVVDLESAELRDRFRLTVADEDSEIAVRRLFTPALIVDVLDSAQEGTRIEFEQGALVVAVGGHRYGVDTFDALIGLATAIAGQVAALDTDRELV